MLVAPKALILVEIVGIFMFNKAFVDGVEVRTKCGWNEQLMDDGRLCARNGKKVVVLFAHSQMLTHEDTRHRIMLKTRHKFETQETNFEYSPPCASQI